MLNIFVLFVLCISGLSGYYIRLESPTSNYEQRLLLSPQLQETYQIHPQQIVPLYRFQYPNQQILYYNPQTLNSPTSELHTINPEHFNGVVSRLTGVDDDTSNDAVTIENPEFQAPIKQQDDQRYYIVDEENPPVFYGDIDQQSGQPVSPIFSIQPLQQVAHNVQEKSSMSESTTMRIIVEDEEEKQETSSISSSSAEELATKEVAVREKQAEELKESIGDDGSVASAKPSAIALAGEGGVASSKPRATAITGDGGYSVASPSGTAIAGDYSELLSEHEDLVNIKKSGKIATAAVIKEYRKKLLS